ncbi:50S ribosomal protein L18 [Patescibacteria group bacterium]|nr:50S ribosomal protein L18 [Patescibacteria group bacterium]
MSNPTKEKRLRALRRARRTRAKVSGTSDRPRLSVFRSSKHILAQVIDDDSGRTIAASSDASLNVKGKKPVEVATLVGADVAKKAKAAGVSTVVFDRGSYKYHGRVKALAEAVREGGLKF